VNIGQSVFGRSKIRLSFIVMSLERLTTISQNIYLSEKSIQNLLPRVFQCLSPPPISKKSPDFVTPKNPSPPLTKKTNNYVYTNRSQSIRLQRHFRSADRRAAKLLRLRVSVLAACGFRFGGAGDLALNNSASETHGRASLQTAGRHRRPVGATTPSGGWGGGMIQNICNPPKKNSKLTHPSPIQPQKLIEGGLRSARL
jgi:hypothetical protein